MVEVRVGFRVSFLCGRFVSIADTNDLSAGQNSESALRAWRSNPRISI